MASFAPRSMKKRNVKGLALDPSAQQGGPSLGDSSSSHAHDLDAGAASSIHDNLEIGVEFLLDLRAEDLVVLKELGAGNGGSVSKVQHKTTKSVMARKIIHVEAKQEIRKRIVRELGIMHECNSPYIVSFYGAFMNPSGDVVMCMEYMDVGSLDAISKNFGPVRIDVLGKIAEAILGGLTYLYSEHKIMHRDIKPSNVLLNSKGNIKLCDFGVSSELENSVADTFVGTGTYMAPERIQGSAYTVKSDVWSVGLTLMELAIGKFPFAADADPNDEDSGPQGILDLLQQIVLDESPRLPKSDAFPQILDDMVNKCLMKEPERRPTPKELYDHDAFVQAAKRTPVDLQAWAVGLMERHNRRSHLEPGGTIEIGLDQLSLGGPGAGSRSGAARAAPVPGALPRTNSGGARPAGVVSPPPSRAPRPAPLGPLPPPPGALGGGPSGLSGGPVTARYRSPGSTPGSGPSPGSVLGAPRPAPRPAPVLAPGASPNGYGHDYAHDAYGR